MKKYLKFAALLGVLSSMMLAFGTSANAATITVNTLKNTYVYLMDEEGDEQEQVTNGKGIATFENVSVGEGSVFVYKKMPDGSDDIQEMKEFTVQNEEDNISLDIKISPVMDNITYAYESAYTYESSIVDGNVECYYFIDSGDEKNTSYENDKFCMHSGPMTANFNMVGASGKTQFTVQIPGLEFQGSGKASFSLVNGSNAIAVLDYNGSSTKLTIGGTVAAENLPASGDFIVSLDTSRTSNNVTVSYGGQSYSGTTAEKSITGLTMQTSDTNTFVLFKSYQVGKPVELTVSKTAGQYMGTAPTTGKVSAIPVSENGKADDANKKEFDLEKDFKKLTTIYIKTDTPIKYSSNEYESPVVIIDGTEYAPKYRKLFNEMTFRGGYFIYQFADIDVKNAVVTYTGAVPTPITD